MLKKRLWAILIGAGLALFPIHNQWLTRLATDSHGVNQFFLPAFGMALWAIGASLYLVWNVDWRHFDWGGKQVLIPMLTICAAIVISSAAQPDWSNRLAQLGTGVALFAVYLASRDLGKDVFLPLAVGAAAASVGVLVSAILQPGHVTGGLVFEHNYDIVAGYVLLGAAVFINKYRWVLAALAAAAMLLTGSPEAIFALAVLGVTLAIRGDWNRQAVAASGVAVVLLAAYIWSGQGARLYTYLVEVATGKDTMTIEDGRTGETAIGYRLLMINTAMSRVQPFGEGYTMSRFKEGTVHNVPLVIVQQLGWPGVAAGVAWLWLVAWGIVKTKWKYAFVVIATLSLWDHYFWTQCAPFFPALMGVATARDSITDDRIFRTTVDV